MNKQHILSLWSWSKGFRGLFLLGLIGVVAEVLLAFVSPTIITTTVDSVLGDKPFALPGFVADSLNNAGGRDFLRANIWVCGVVVAVMALIAAIFVFMRGSSTNRGAEGMLKKLRGSLYDHIQRLPYEYHVKAETGDIIQRCTVDTDTIRRFIGGQLNELCRILLMFIVSVIVMFSIHSGMALVSLALTPVIVVVSVIFFARIQKQYTVVEQADGTLSTTIQENLTGVRVVRAFGRERFEMNKFASNNSDLRQKGIKLSGQFAAFWGITDGIVGAQMFIVMVVGILFTVSGGLTLGQFILFNIYSSQLMWPLRNFGRILGDTGKTLIAVGRIDEVLHEKQEKLDVGVTPPMSGDIVFDNVQFSYGDKDVLKGFTTTVKGGETVAILGTVGSGKSSVMYLLQQLYPYGGGSIKIGGVELRDIARRYGRSRVGMVMQEPFLYSKTIRENIGITTPGASDEMIHEAARMAAVHDVIQDFEHGYDTVVGERGVTLSGGQKQRVAIARALVSDTDILVFDDALSAVDAETDIAIREALGKRRAGVTTFIISQRIATLMEADRILVLEDGRVSMEGTHEQLVARDGLYKRIYDIQSLQAE